MTSYRIRTNPRSRIPRGGRSRLGRFVALVIIGAVALTGCDFSVYSLPLPGGASLGNHPYSVTIDFQDVLDLVPQSAVKVDDVTVGKVDQITLNGYTARVTVLIRGDVKLPDNAVAQIRQTSLLGEKFVSLAPPSTGASSGRLGNGDVIPLSRTGRNPEVEEVLGALSLLLNGGGVAQLKTIASELNSALGGRESSVRDVLSQLNTFMGQLDTNKSQIVKAIESLNALSKSLDRQKGTITLALDKLPAAVASINRQRDDLVLMLKSLARLSHIGTRVIGASKAATIDSLNALAPTLTKLADAGSALPKALQVFLTYPFVDAVVGRNPTQARNLHMGDYTNLSAQLSLDLRGLGNGPPGQLDCRKHPNNPLCHVLPPPGKVVSLVKKCLKSRDITSKPCKKLLKTANGLKRLQKACKHKSNKKNPVCLVALGLPTGGPLPTKLPKHLPTALPTKVKIPGVGRAPPNMSGPPSAGSTVHPSYDSSLGALLVWGMVPR